MRLRCTLKKPAGYNVSGKLPAGPGEQCPIRHACLFSISVEGDCWAADGEAEKGPELGR